MTSHTEDFEIIVVDDKSSEDLQAKPIVNKFRKKLNIKLVYRDKKEGMNPGMCLNIGAKLAEGDLILIQDSAYIHATSIINQLIGKYIFGWDMALFPSGYSLSKENQNFLESFDMSEPSSIIKIRSAIQYEEREIRGDGDDGWYVHSHFCPVTRSGIFCMRRDTFYEMGGFDEDFYRYWGNEDTDFINRLRLKEVPILYHDDMLALHQHHYDTRDIEDIKNRREGWIHNQQLWMNEKKDRTDWVANRGREWGVL